MPNNKQFELTRPPPAYLLPQWPLSPMLVVEARVPGLPQGHFHIATVSAHFGKAPYWYFELERHSALTTHPRDQRFMPLEDALSTFESETGITLPGIDLYGEDAAHRYERGTIAELDAPSPLSIVVGREYHFKSSSGNDMISGRYVGVGTQCGPRLVRAHRLSERDVTTDGLALRHLSAHHIHTLVTTNLREDARPITEEAPALSRPRN